jgi:hypothetical protein
MQFGACFPLEYKFDQICLAEQTIMTISGGPAIGPHFMIEL